MPVLNIPAALAAVKDDEDYLADILDELLERQPELIETLQNAADRYKDCMDAHGCDNPCTDARRACAYNARLRACVTMPALRLACTFLCACVRARVCISGEPGTFYRAANAVKLLVQDFALEGLRFAALKAEQAAKHVEQKVGSGSQRSAAAQPRTDS